MEYNPRQYIHTLLRDMVAEEALPEEVTLKQKP